MNVDRKREIARKRALVAERFAALTQVEGKLTARLIAEAGYYLPDDLYERFLREVYVIIHQPGAVTLSASDIAGRTVIVIDAEMTHPVAVLLHEMAHWALAHRNAAPGDDGDDDREDEVDLLLWQWSPAMERWGRQSEWGNGLTLSRLRHDSPLVAWRGAMFGEEGFGQEPDEEPDEDDEPAAPAPTAPDGVQHFLTGEGEVDDTSGGGHDEAA